MRKNIIERNNYLKTKTIFNQFITFTTYIIFIINVSKLFAKESIEKKDQIKPNIEKLKYIHKPTLSNTQLSEVEALDNSILNNIVADNIQLNDAKESTKIEETDKYSSPFNKNFKENTKNTLNIYNKPMINMYCDTDSLWQKLNYNFRGLQPTLTKKEIMILMPEIEERLNVINKYNIAKVKINRLTIANLGAKNITKAEELNKLNNLAATCDIDKHKNKQQIQMQISKYKNELSNKQKEIKKQLNKRLLFYKKDKVISLYKDIGRLEAQVMVLEHNLKTSELHDLWLQNGVSSVTQNKEVPNDFRQIGFPGEFYGGKKEYNEIFAKKITEINNIENNIENAMLIGNKQKDELLKLTEEKERLLAEREKINDKWGGKDTFDPEVANMIKTTMRNAEMINKRDDNKQDDISYAQKKINKSNFIIKKNEIKLANSKNILNEKLKQLNIRNEQLNDKKKLLLDTVTELTEVKYDFKSIIKAVKQNKTTINKSLNEVADINYKTEVLNTEKKIKDYTKQISIGTNNQKSVDKNLSNNLPNTDNSNAKLSTVVKEQDVPKTIIQSNNYNDDISKLQEDLKTLRSKEDLYNESIDNVSKIDNEYKKLSKNIQQENTLIRSSIKETNNLLKVCNLQKIVTEQEIVLINYKMKIVQFENEKAKLKQEIKQEELELVKMQTLDSRAETENKLQEEINNIGIALANNNTKLEQMKKQKEILTAQLVSTDSDIQNLNQALETLKTKKKEGNTNKKLLSELDSELQKVADIQQPSLFISPKILIRSNNQEQNTKQLSASQKAQLKTISYINNNVDKVRYANNKKLNTNIQNSFKDNIVNDGKNIGSINDSMWYSINIDMSNDRDDLTKSSNGSTLINFGYNFNYIDNIDSSVAVSFNQTKSDLKMYSKDIPVNTYDFVLSLFNKYNLGNDIVLSSMLSYNHNIVKDRRTKNIQYDYVDENDGYIISNFTKPTHKKHYNDLSLSLSALYNYNILDNVKLTSGITANYFTTHKLHKALILSPTMELSSVNGFYHNVLFPIVYVKYNANTNNKNIRVSDTRKVNLDKNNMEYGIKTKVGLTDKANISFTYSGDSNKNNGVGANLGVEF